jgi:lysozyme family protein
MPTFETLKGEYGRLWRNMQAPPAHAAAIDTVANRALKNKPRYVAVEQQINVPWFLIAILHNRESGMDFRCHLHNGDPLTARTVQVPAGRPKTGRPPFTWQESAIDALTMAPHELHRVDDWTIERVCYEAEKYNGWGYRSHGIFSPYLWSYSSNYEAGKYVADGKWSSAAVDKQIGCMPLLRCMMELDPAIGETLDVPAFHQERRNAAPKPQPAPPLPDVEPPKPREPKSPAQSKTIWAALATFLSSLLGVVTDWRILAVLVVGALAGFIIYQRYMKDDIAKLFGGAR